MDKYIHNDIIVYPTSKKAKNCIGKMVYFADSPSECLSYANNNNKDYCQILRGINIDKSSPFLLNSGFYDCIILKKEESKLEYTPFKSKTEFIKAYKSVEAKKLRDEIAYLSEHGMWLRQKCDSEDSMILSVSPDGVFVLDTFYTWELLIKDFLFLDGSPCGKLKENK